MLAALWSVLSLAAGAKAAVSGLTSLELLGPGSANELGVWMAINNGLIPDQHNAPEDSIFGGLYVDSTGFGGGLTSPVDQGDATPAPASFADDVRWGTLTDNPPSLNGRKAYCQPQPVSHFDKNAPQEQFCQRYWVDTQYYSPGGPIIVFDVGESAADAFYNSYTNGSLSLTGKLAQTYHGMVIILEHRYFGWSLPTADFSTDNLQWLTNKEALADSANLIKNWQPPKDVFPNLDAATVRPDKSPWIYVGGSYPGGRAAHMRLLYPDLVFGAISSSGVTVAKADYHEYFDAIENYGDPACIGAIHEAIRFIDTTLDRGANDPIATELKGLFGLQELRHADFASVLRSPLFSWQSRSWRADQMGTSVFKNKFCPAMLQHPGGTYIGNCSVAVPESVVNYVNYLKPTIGQCTGHIKECYSTEDATQFHANDHTQAWRLWLWLQCTEWGYFQGGRGDDKPFVVSKYLSYDFNHNRCVMSFPPGKSYQIPPAPLVENVNKLGGYDVKADRLALINGEEDPWRPVTPGSPYIAPRQTTLQQPWWIVKGSVHTWDLFWLAGEPKALAEVHAYDMEYFSDWMLTWSRQHPQLVSQLANIFPASAIPGKNTTQPAPAGSEAPQATSGEQPVPVAYQGGDALPEGASEPNKRRRRHFRA